MKLDKLIFLGEKQIKVLPRLLTRMIDSVLRKKKLNIHFFIFIFTEP